MIALGRMSEIKKWLGFLVFVLLIYPNSLMAQTGPHRNTLDGFDIAASTLPKNFKGNSFALLQDELHKKFLRIKRKSKFESDQEFNSRLDRERESIAEEPLLGFMTLKDMWVFVFDPGFEYDAEKQGFYAINTLVPDFTFPGGGLYADEGNQATREEIWGLQPLWVINFQEKRRKVGSYFVRNNFGMRFKVVKDEMYRRELYIASCKEGDFASKDYSMLGWGAREFKTFVPASGERAKSLDGNLRYLLVMEEFVPPYFSAVKFTVSPSIPDYLEDSAVHLTQSFGKLSSLWVFNNKTGEVIKKYHPCEIKSADDKVQNLYLF